MPSSFEIFPPELIEMIFRYLSGLDIYLSFGRLNHRFDRLLANYHYITLNFRSISKLKFDSLMEYIRPSDIYGLTLSNSRETIEQIELFLSHWKLSDFINLRSLHLHQIDQRILSLVSHDIIKLSNLLILRIDGRDMNGSFFLEDFSQLPYLQYLCVPNFHHWSWNIHPSPTNKLIHLDLRCHVQKIPYIFILYSSLRSVNLVIDPPWMTNNHVPSLRLLPEDIYRPLIRLSITSQNVYGAKQFEWSEIEQLLQGFSTHLKYLTLNIPTTINVLNGHKWQRFLMNFSCLKTFNVKFHSLYNMNQKDILDRFRSPFWSKEKKWYFTVMNNALCSLSFYDGTMLTTNLRVPNHTASNDDWFYSYPVIQFDSDKLTETFVNNRQRPKRLFKGQELQLTGNFSKFYATSVFQLVEETVDLSCIKKLRCINSKLTSEFLLRLMERLFYLLELEISFASYTKKDVEKFSRFERIQRIDHSSELSAELTKDFIRIFPNVEYLVLNVQLRRQIFQLISELIRLQSAQFRYNSKAKIITRNELIQRTRLCNHSFTSSTNFSNQQLSLWINQVPSSRLIKKKSLINSIKQKKFLFALLLFIFLLLPLIVCISYFL